MTLALRSIRAASEEFETAVRWYEDRRTGLGAEFFDAVSTAIDLISERPEIGPIDASGVTRRLLVKRFPYHVVYFITQEQIVVVAIAHLKRRPNYWRGRK
ncbi:MAG: type II toxin-antitoxin system RelE/ParE family toxin [Acidiferrobacterales bacterium]